MDRQAARLAINSELMAYVGRAALLQAISDALRRVIPLDRTAVFLHDPARDVLRLYVLTASLPSSYFQVGLEMSSRESHVGWVFTNRQPLLRRDLAAEQAYPAEAQALADGVRSYAIVPLVARGTAVGVLAVASRQVGQYDDRDVSKLVVDQHQALMWEVGDLIGQWEALQEHASEGTAVEAGRDRPES